MALMALAVGSTLAGSLLDAHSQRGKMKELARLQRQAIQPLKDRLFQANTGLSTSEGDMVQATQSNALTQLAGQGVLDSSFAPSQVAAASAPVALQAQQRRDTLTERIAAAEFQIAGTEASAPGFGEAFGGALGEIGGFLALRQGLRDANPGDVTKDDSGKKKKKGFLGLFGGDQGVVE